MILTTNRMLAIDPAFESRIDMTLVYSEHSEAAREKIWRNFTETIDGHHQLDDAALKALAAAPLNGRQIKSAIKTARALAASEDVPLAQKHLELVITLRQKSIKLLDGGKNEEGRC
jgi:SpoVK/Ycf46/Vps4 family AAA+-type ATPase